MIETTAQPLETWQVWKSLRRILGDSELIKIHKVELRQLQRWSADPRTTESSAPNPDDRYEVSLNMLMERGREDLARTRVSRAAHIVGCELRCLDAVDPDGKSLHEECLDDLPKLAAYHQVLTGAKSQVEEVRAAWQAAKRELDENYELWVRLHAGTGGHNGTSLDS